MIYTAAGFNSSFSVTNILTATGHNLRQLLDPLLKLLCFPLNYFVVQTLDQDIGREEDDENGNVTAADMETSQKLLEEVSRKIDVCLSNLHALLKGLRQVYAVIHQFSGLLKFRIFCFQGNHNTPLICTSLGTSHGGRGPGVRMSLPVLVECVCRRHTVYVAVTTKSCSNT